MRQSRAPNILGSPHDYSFSDSYDIWISYSEKPGLYEQLFYSDLMHRLLSYQYEQSFPNRCYVQRQRNMPLFLWDLLLLNNAGYKTNMHIIYIRQIYS